MAFLKLKKKKKKNRKGSYDQSIFFSMAYIEQTGIWGICVSCVA